MPRIPLATDLKTRTGAPEGKDARIKNAYVETRGGQSVVRKRPIAQGGISVATIGSIAQGGIGFTTYSGGSSSSGLFFLSGDTQSTYTGDGTTWNVETNYVTGDHVTKNWKDYWAIDNNIANDPSVSPTHWSPVPTFYTPPAISYHNGTQQNTNGGWGWSTLFAAFDIANICTSINLVPRLLNYNVSPYGGQVDWYNSSGVFQTTSVVNIYDPMQANGLAVYEMIAAVSTNAGVVIATWPNGGGTLRLVLATNSTYSVLADIAAASTSPGATLLFRFRMNADNLGNCYILETSRSLLSTTKKISSAGVVTDLGVVPLPS